MMVRDEDKEACLRVCRHSACKHLNLHDRVKVYRPAKPPRKYRVEVERTENRGVWVERGLYSTLKQARAIGDSIACSPNVLRVRILDARDLARVWYC